MSDDFLNAYAEIADTSDEAMRWLYYFIGYLNDDHQYDGGF